MAYDLELADPLVEVRDVAESYRVHEVVLPEWKATIEAAVRALSELPPDAGVDVRLPGLLPLLRTLIDRGISREPATVEAVARQVAEALSRIELPGVPSPHEDDWAFRTTT